MLGVIIGDIVGSRFEWHNHKSKNFEFFHPSCFPTDDSIMTLAVAKALAEANEDYTDLGELAVYYMQTIGRPYPDCGYGGHFFDWIYSDDPMPYYSFGNGAAMRVSPCGFKARSLEESIALSKAVTEVSHNHPEGIKGAEAVAVAVYLAKRGASKEQIRKHIDTYYYPMNFTLDEIRPTYEFDVTCQGSVPQAIMAFLESENFEDAIRNAISIGGDSDTIAAITGGIAEAYYGVPRHLMAQVLLYLDRRMTDILFDLRRKRFNP